MSEVQTALNEGLGLAANHGLQLYLSEENSVI